MSRHDDLIRMRHMLDHAVEIVKFARDRNRSDLDRDRLLNLALVRLLEIIGEAATRVSIETRSQHPNIPWAQIAGMRNRLIHGYESVDLDVVWQIVRADLPRLITELERVLVPPKA